jgi:hypothetical protein
MMRSKRNSFSHVRKHHTKWALWACVLVTGSFSCSESDSGSNNVPPGREASTDDVAPDAPSNMSDAPTTDTRPAGDAHSDASIDRAPDRSSDAAIERSIDATDRDQPSDGDDRSADAIDRDVSVDTVSSDQASDGLGGDAVGDQAATSDSDAPPLSATCSVDQPCVNGNCQGLSCDKAWSCFGHFAPHPCPVDIVVPYCGCDGKTYYFPVTCPEVPYEYAGECGDGVNCDPNDVRCAQPEPDCSPGSVASVVAGCYGPCVPINSCRCIFAFECPKRELYDCNAEQRCSGAPAR